MLLLLCQIVTTGAAWRLHRSFDAAAPEPRPGTAVGGNTFQIKGLVLTPELARSLRQQVVYGRRPAQR